MPPPANQLADCWAALENFINDVPQPTVAIIKAALSHVQFETIHPFLDGNGRLGRMLILGKPVFCSNRCCIFPCFSNRIVKPTKACCNRYASAATGRHGCCSLPTPSAATANQAVSTVQALTQLLEQDKTRLAELGRLAGSARHILDALFARPILNIAALCKTTGLTAATVGKALDAMQVS